MKNSKKKKTLFYVLLLGACCVVYALIAIPPMLFGRRGNGNEASAISSLRTLTTVNEQYLSRYGSYASSLAVLQKEGYIDTVLASRVKSGYKFCYHSCGSKWSTATEPTSWRVTGERSFFTDETGVIRFEYEERKPATDHSPPID